MARKGMREVTAPAFRAGAQTQEALERRHTLSALHIKKAYGVTITGGSGAGDVLADAGYRHYREIRLMAKGGAIHNVRGHTLGKIAEAWFPRPPSQTDPANDAVGAQTDLESYVILPFFMPHSSTPDEFVLPTAIRGVEPQLQLSHANAEELFDSDVDFTSAAFDDVELSLYEVPIFGIAPQTLARLGGTSIQHTLFDPTTTGSKRVELSHLNEGDELRAVIVEGLSGGSDGIQHAHDDAVIDHVGALNIDGKEEFEQIDFRAIQQRNKVEYDLDSRLTGTAIFDAAEDRRTGRGELWPIVGAQKPTIRVEYTKQTGDNRIVVTTVACRRGRPPARRR